MLANLPIGRFFQKYSSVFGEADFFSAPAPTGAAVKQFNLLTRNIKHDKVAHFSRSYMKILLFLMPILLFSEELSVIDTPALNHKYSTPSEDLPKKSFTYLNPGITTSAVSMLQSEYNRTHKGFFSFRGKNRLPLVVSDLSFGARTLSTKHVFDRVVGIVFHPSWQLLYVQGSYLFFPTASEKFYFGAGATLGLYHTKNLLVSLTMPPTFIYLNVPITLGYQFLLNKRFQFIQIQCTLLRTGTISYGMGF